ARAAASRGGAARRRERRPESPLLDGDRSGARGRGARRRRPTRAPEGRRVPERRARARRRARLAAVRRSPPARLDLPHGRSGPRRAVLALVRRGASCRRLRRRAQHRERGSARLRRGRSPRGGGVRVAAARDRAGAAVRATRIGIVGLGRMGRLHATNIGERVHRLELVAASDPAESAGAAARELGIPLLPDWRELVARPDVEAVLVCSPADHHAEQIAVAAGAGKHVFCEKPLGRTLPEIERVLAAVDEAGTVLQVGFNRRADRNFAGLRERLVAGELETPWLLKITSRDPHPQPKEYVLDSGGLFVDMAIHDFDLARFLLGDVVSVSATGGALVDPELAELGDVDTAITTLTFASGALGVIDNCRRASYGYDQRVEVHGRLGMLAAENELASTVQLADASGFHRPPLPEFFLDRYGDAYARELEIFAAAVAGEAPPLADGVDGQQAVALAVAARLSLAEQRTVPLTEVLS